jgi:hypothetical protein
VPVAGGVAAVLRRGARVRAHPAPGVLQLRRRMVRQNYLLTTVACFFSALSICLPSLASPDDMLIPTQAVQLRNRHPPSAVGGPGQPAGEDGDQPQGQPHLLPGNSHLINQPTPLSNNTLHATAIEESKRPTAHAACACVYRRPLSPELVLPRFVSRGQPDTICMASRVNECAC